MSSEPLFDYLEANEKAVRSALNAPGEIRFAGSDYDKNLDKKRLTGQLLRVFELMKDGRWRTLQEIADLTHDPAASVSAQLRHLRKEHFGGHVVNKRARGERSHGLFEYQLEVNK
jgi:hypothetical protein